MLWDSHAYIMGKGQRFKLLVQASDYAAPCSGCCAGALPPSGGDIRVMGHSLLTADGLEVAQGVMGVCPQFDVLWDELSGQEHMYIYGCIKGLPSTEVSGTGTRANLQGQQHRPEATNHS
jgi:hypothetical protein